ncbi:hypothetical protein SAMN05421820_114111 [Pedobacter steynii]|uniref:AhpC/TSA family protein n=1 Tax=Pedobacter steynii TaxID=430522 RepID=A0A1H0J8V1_9SPHI|nr:hypothetical protein [Pedobacter steynii]NQX43060.1 hypothetical protein [Pedobacter steynii]SDO39909.1 hypothetical protein SAMN05421820_114111 [Pedobacter steynii]
MRNIYLYLFVILLICNGILLYNKSNSRDKIAQYQIKMNGLIANQKSELTEAKNSLSSVLKYLDIIQLPIRDIQVKQIQYSLLDPKKTKSQYVKLSNILNSKKVLFRFFRTACSSCIKDQINSLNLLGRKIGRDRIILLTDHLDDEIKIFLLRSGIELNIYETAEESLLPDFDKKQIPYLFTSDRDLLINTPFIISIESKYLSETFYKRIESKF